MKLDFKGLAFVATQLILIVAYFVYPNSISIGIPRPLALAATTIAILGLVLTSIATIQLNTRLSPFPKPKTNAVLIQTGAYKHVRHPIYSGLFLFAIGWAIHDGNVTRFGIAIVLLGLFYLKAKYEEQFLENAFSEYPAYKAKTGMLFPKRVSRKSNTM